jgi:hypothetical protein
MEYKILVICGESQVTKHHIKIISLIKTYCNNLDISISNTKFENLNIYRHNNLSLCNLHENYKLIPPGMHEYCESEDRRPEDVEIINHFNEEHNNYYDYIYLEHCPKSDFDIQYIKWFNMLKLGGYLIFFDSLSYYDNNSLINPNIMNNVIINQDKPERTEKDHETIRLYMSEINPQPEVTDLLELHQLQSMNKCSKIFTRINKFMFRKDKDTIFDMYKLSKDYINYISNFNPLPIENLGLDEHRKYLKYKEKYLKQVSYFNKSQP